MIKILNLIVLIRNGCITIVYSDYKKLSAFPITHYRPSVKNHCKTAKGEKLR